MTSDSSWPVHDTQITFDCPFFTVGFDRVERPDGEVVNYYWVDPWNGVSIVAQTPGGDLVLVEEYRPRHRRSFLSFPKGGVNDETFREAAARELREETGWVAENLEVVRKYYSSGWLRQTRAVVYASDLDRGERSLEDGEYIDVRTLTPTAAKDLLEADPVPAWTLLPLVAVERAGIL